MLLDARTVPDGAVLSADLCIIGGGAAGITIALEFIDAPVDVILLESGGLNPDSATQSLYAGDNVGLPYENLDESRCRFLGGSTNCWGGACRPLDPIDFMPRPWMPESGWPLRREDLDPFYMRSQELLQLGPFDYDPRSWMSRAKSGGASLFSLVGEDLVNAIGQLSPPSRFGRLYRSQLSSAARLRVLLRANVTEIGMASTAATIDKVQVATLSGTTFSVTPKIVVLATGGIENARLLLASNRARPAGLGNEHDLVGRYFMDHPRIRSSVVKLNGRCDGRRYDHGFAMMSRRLHVGRLEYGAHLAPSESMQRKAELPNSRTYLLTKSFGSFAQSYSDWRKLRQRLDDGSRGPAPFGDAIADIYRKLSFMLRHAPRTAVAILDTMLPPVIGQRTYELETVFEPIPNPESRVTLTSKRDRLGMNIIKLDWRLDDRDRSNYVATGQFLRTEAERQGLFFVMQPQEYPASDWPSNIRWCWHHMGTTRMNPDPLKGVVNNDCRVHGISNLYVAGSSVFPTAGSDMPTMTIVALALRLSDHIASVLWTGETISEPVSTEPKGRPASRLNGFSPFASRARVKQPT